MTEKPNWFKSRLSLKPPVVSDPRLFKTSTKGFILVGLALCACTSGFSSTIYFPGLPAITADLHAPPIATTLTAALFVLAMGIAPVFWASISDFYQVRRILLMFSMLIFAAASIGSAFINNIWGLVVLRCVQSVGSSCGTSVGAGVIADCYPIEQRGAAFGKFFAGVMGGPLLGPIIGGFLITSALSWRATFWFCFALALSIFTYLFFFFPETFRVNARFDAELPTTSAAVSSNSMSSETIDEITKSDNSEKDNKIVAPAALPVKRSLNPFGAFLMLRHPFIFMSSIISGIAFGCMFAIETIIPDLYETRYGFNPWQTGLSYLGAGVGNILGSILGGMLSDRLLLRSRRLRGGKAVVEDRLTANLWPCVFIFMPFGILLFGWSIEKGLAVWAPIIAFGIQTFGMSQVMTASSAYLVDAVPGQGASATAAANLVRMILACGLTLAANPMVAAIGPGYTCVFLAALSVFACTFLVVLKLKGEKLRAWSGFH